MADLTNFAEDAVANAFRGVAFSTSTFLGLYTSPTDELGGGTEVSDAGYARLSVTFGPPVGGVITNTIDLTFGAAVTNYTVTHIAILDALTGGNMLMQKALSIPVSISIGSAFEVLAGNLSFTAL